MDTYFGTEGVVSLLLSKSPNNSSFDWLWFLNLEKMLVSQFETSV